MATRKSSTNSKHNGTGRAVQAGRSGIEHVTKQGASGAYKTIAIKDLQRIGNEVIREHRRALEWLADK